MYKSVCGMFSFLLCKYLGVELEHAINACSTFKETTKLITKVVLVVYILLHNI